RFVHDENAKSSRIKNTTRNNTDELLSKLIGQLGLNNKVSSSNASEISKSSTIANSIPGASLTSPSPPPVAYHAMAGPTFIPPSPYYHVPPALQNYTAHQFTLAQPFGYYLPPSPGFPHQPAQPGQNYHPA
ncbi:hypothetical protein Tco_1574202, partial [Tanacetum coccineum]